MNLLNFVQNNRSQNNLPNGTPYAYDGNSYYGRQREDYWDEIEDRPKSTKRKAPKAKQKAPKAKAPKAKARKGKQ